MTRPSLRTRRCAVRGIARLVAALTVCMTWSADNLDAQVMNPQGPAPIRTSNPIREYSGCLQAILVDPTVNGLAYVGSVNGGIWRTENLYDPRPTWVPLTDTQGSLSIADLAFSPFDLSWNTIFAAIGDYSSYGRIGGPLIGLLKSTDGGDTWTNVARATLGNQHIRRVVPTLVFDVNSNQQIVLAASQSQGIFRSIDGGNVFQLVPAASGLPAVPASDLVADPGNPRRFYAALPRSGIFRTDDAGQTWTNITGTLASLTTTVGSWCNPCSVLGNSDRIVLAVGPAPSHPLYAAMIFHYAGTGCGSASPFDIFRWDGSSWAAMGVRASDRDLAAGGDACLKFALLAHATDENVVFAVGDVGGVWRGSVGSWTQVDGADASMTSPHADGRLMVYDFNERDILEASDGGLARLVNPDGTGSPPRRWDSVNGSLQVTECFSASYDALTDLLFTGTQDNGTPVQDASGSPSYIDVTGGDGGTVGIDLSGADNGASSVSIRYTQVGCNVTTIQRRSYGPNNNFISTSPMMLASSSTPTTRNSGLHKNAMGELLFCGPTGHAFVINGVSPAQVLVAAGDGLFDSENQGDVISDVTPVTGVTFVPWVYGGRMNGVDYPLFAYVSGSNNWLYQRPMAGGSFGRVTTYPGTSVAAVQTNPWDLRRAYASDGARVYQTPDDGTTWNDITGNLAAVGPTVGAIGVRAIEVIQPSPVLAGREVVLVAGFGGIYYTLNPGSASGTTWSRYGASLPNVIVMSLRYWPRMNTGNGPRGDVLVASTFGRGLWDQYGVAQQLFGDCYSYGCNPSVTWVDFTHSGASTGCADQPYSSLLQAFSAASVGGRLAIVSGVSSEVGTYSKRVRLSACEGTVVVGRASAPHGTTATRRAKATSRR